jgi:tetratricopeptide (TPR) repeat protein
MAKNTRYNLPQSRYSLMRRAVFLSILFVSLILVAGCVSQTTNPLPPAPGDPSVQSGGSALAIAFKTDEISTTSPEAKEQFIKGLTYSTQYAHYNDSLAFFDAALAIDRNFSEAWIAKGVALHNMKRYDEAIDSYDMAITINPDDPGAWSVKCITIRDSGKTAGAAECNQRAGENSAGYRNNPGSKITPARTQSCDSLLPPVPAGGDVWIGERCLNVSAAVSSGQAISWYNNGHPGNATPDASRIVRDARNFSPDPAEFVGYEGTWYVGTTDTVAFVVRVPILDTRKN